LSTAVVSVRVRRELKEEAERLGVDIRSVVEKALEEEVKQAKLSKLRSLLDRTLESMDVSVEEWIQAVREVRTEE